MGPDEVRARQLLLDMMELLSRDPYEALGLIPSATAADIRNAFLTKTKQFHPARFGRMAGDIQRLANEVFLSLRAAHENLARPTTTKAPALRPGSPVPRALGSAAMPRPAGAVPPSAVPAPSGRPLTQPNRTVEPQAAARAGTQSGRMGDPQTAQQQQLRTATPVRPGQAPPPQQPARMASPSPPPQQVVRPGGVAARPTAPGAPAARPTAPGAPAARSTGSAAPAARPGTGPVDAELVPIYALFEQNQLGAAKTAIEKLVARTPQSTKYKALLAYAKGRAAQLDNRIDEARVELNEALMLDKDLQLAKTAFTELMSRRR